ncbi:hypothetical protein [Breznakiella homolactica]|uniref:DUF4468 domain-containing protein n=1 Tax=Breznakiella homolactica TaxID=2798577 RepID=A0A7T8BC30_9SPIR|nr:hypothetical protein [Breznakiella homolactica]QQO10715.1 hypothetical protein JFL75_07320 [Breznakiella homolactica]
MINEKKILGICFLCIFISCIAESQENPAKMFTELYDKYKKTEYKTVVLSQRGEGAGMFIFDINKRISNDVFCRVELMSTLGQIQYIVYKRDGENIWYFYKKAYFYEAPMKLENAEIQETYFKYLNDLPYVFNEVTEKYDIQADTEKYRAITDVDSLLDLLKIVQNAISENRVSTYSQN